MSYKGEGEGVSHERHQAIKNGPTAIHKPRPHYFKHDKWTKKPWKQRETPLALKSVPEMRANDT